MTVTEYVAWAKDMCEHAVEAYAYSFVTLICASGALDVDAVTAALLAALPAAFAVIKSALAYRVGDKGTASFTKRAL